ncbi:MAG: TOMM system kinase/cyclase fusion protein [Pseudomonadota bacterium]
MNTHHIAAVPGYELMDCLGEGATGVVHQARQHSTGQLVAIKLLRTAGVRPGVARERLEARFARETHLCAQLHHPHIVRLLDKGKTSADELYAVFEFVPGMTLRDLIALRGPLPAVQAGTVMLQVMDALATAHAQGIVHRDLKPTNIMISGHGTRLHAKVLDFGLGTMACDLGQLGVRDLTLTSEILGTPRYCAPEQLRGEPPTVKSDLYAWGLCLLECLTGKPTIQGATVAEVYHQHLSTAELSLPTALRGQALGALLRGVLRKDPRARGPSAAELHERGRRINWSGIVGSIGKQKTQGHDPALDITRTDVMTQERRQIIMLGFSLESPPSAQPPDTDTLEDWLKEQVVRCQDICTTHGGILAGAFGTLHLVYFGYPETHESASRHAAQAALELIDTVTRDAVRFEMLSGVALSIRVAMHATMVVARSGHVPTSFDATALARQVLQAPPGHVALSDRARHLLHRHFPTREITDARSGAAHILLAERFGEASTDRSPGRHLAMVGRTAELQMLTTLWQQVQAGGSSGTSLIVEGAPGIGKSCLLQALCTQVRETGGTAWVLHGLPEQRNCALHPFMHWLHGLLQSVGSPSEPLESRSERLKAMVIGSGLSAAEATPIIASWLGLPLPHELAPLPHTPGRQKKIMIDSLIRLLQTLARGPQVLVVEDIHWLDPTSRELLDRLLAGDAGPSMGLLMSSRPERDYRPNVNVLPLQGLNAHEAIALVQRENRGPALSAFELTRLTSRADGNPLFLTELIRGHSTMQAPAYLGRAAADDVPASLRDVLGQSLDTLGAAKETAQFAAVIGREFGQSLLQRISQRQGTVLQRDLEQLVAADLVHHKSSTDEDTYTFRHALIRDAAYGSLTRELRQLAHARVAQALVNRAGTTPADLAHHHAGAGMYGQAVACLTEAARTSLERSLHEETHAMCKQALAWNHLRIDGVLECAESELAVNRTLLPALSALHGLGNAELLKLSERDAALLDIVGRQRPMASRDSQSEQSWRKECLAFQAMHFSANCARTIQLGEDILERLRAQGLRQAQLQVLPLLGQAYHWAGDLETAQARFLHALKLYRPEEDRELWIENVLDPRCQSLFLLSHTLAYAGKVQEARHRIEECMAWACEVRCINAADGGIFFGALIDYLCGDREAINAAAGAHEAAHADTTEDHWLMAGWRMVHDWANGRGDHTRRFIDASLAAGASGAMCWFEAMLADTEMSQCQADSTLQRLRQGIDRCQRTGEVATLPIQYTMLARASILSEGSMDRSCERYFEEALALSRQHGSHWLGLLAATAYASELNWQHRTHEAREVLALAMGRITEGRTTPLFRQAKACLDAPTVITA